MTTPTILFQTTAGSVRSARPSLLRVQTGSKTHPSRVSVEGVGQCEAETRNYSSLPGFGGSASESRISTADHRSPAPA